MHLVMGSVVQSIFSLRKSLVKDLLSLLVHIISSGQLFFAEKLKRETPQI